MGSKRRSLFLSLTLFLLFLSGASERRTPDALGASLGEPLQVLVDSYNRIGVTASERPDPDTLIYPRTLTPIEGAKRAEYRVSDGVLCEAVVYLKGGKGESPTDIFHKVKNGLIYKYGKPKSDGRELLFHVTRWEFPGMSIRMTEAPYESVGGIITTEIILTYTHKPEEQEGQVKGE